MRQIQLAIPPDTESAYYGMGLLAVLVEAAQFEESLKPRPVPLPCRGCKHFHGVVYNGVLLNCAVHPKGSSDDKCPDWQTFKKSKHGV